MSRRIYRRRFLQGAGGLSLALPLLNMHSQRAGAEPGYSDDGFPLRLILFLHPNGIWPATWWPTAGAGGQTDFQLGASMAPMEAYKDRLTILDGLNMTAADAGPGEPHQSGMGAVWTGQPLQEGDMVGGDGSLAGWGGGISVDQEIAASIGADSLFSSLEFGVRASAFGGGEVRSRMVYSGAAAPLSPDDDPVSGWNRIFADLTLSPSEMAELRAKRLSILDTVDGQFSTLMAKAGAEDRQRLEQHAALVRDLELRLAEEPVLGEACVVPGVPPTEPFDDANTMDRISQRQIDLLVMSLACDVTRVGSVQYSNGRNHTQFPWLGSMTDGHELSHAGDDLVDSWNEWALREHWYCEQFAYLMQQLDAIPEGEGTMLDNTLIVWGNELAKGNTHSHYRTPFVMAGSAGGQFETGRYLQGLDQPHNNLLVSMLNLFGNDAQTFGHPEHCTGPISGLV